MSSLRVLPFTAIVDYPTSPACNDYTRGAILRALESELPSNWTVHTGRPNDELVALQVSDYDQLEWRGVLECPDQILVNSYAIRKALIRKNSLALTIEHYTSKHSSCQLVTSIPTTFYFQLSFVDELEELFLDELYTLSTLLSNDNDNSRWWILKGALVDRGEGIRLVKNRRDLEIVFNEFEQQQEEEEEDQESSRVSSSQVRHWIIQEYIKDPLLIKVDDQEACRKFHLRVYVLAVGSLQVYIYNDMLALFSSNPYIPPDQTEKSNNGVYNLKGHLTNTCLQQQPPTQLNVYLFSSLINDVMTKDIYHDITRKISNVTSEIFKAAIEQSTTFQTLPNSFEIFGIDFLIDSTFNVFLLEINACPDFAQTGSELSRVVDGVWKGAIQLAVLPFFYPTNSEERQDTGYTKCLDIKVRC